MWLREQDVETECRLAAFGGLAPHPEQHLGILKRRLVDAFVEPERMGLLGSSRTLIVLAIDGLAYDVARASWAPDLLAAVTSTFPSVSSTAWLTASTGLTPSEHGVVGVVFEDEAVDGVYNCYLDQEQSHVRTVSPARGIELGPWSTLFSELTAVGVPCTAHVGDLSRYPGRWSRAVTHGAHVVHPPVRRFAEHSVGPADMAYIAMNVVDHTVTSSVPGKPALVWVFLNFDDHVHLNGYDAQVIAALKDLECAIGSWVADGHSVVAYSDHGLVPTHASERGSTVMEWINDSRVCRSPSGGAGRTLWAYPKAECEKELLQRVAELAQPFAHVLSREELVEHALLQSTPLVDRRVGPLVLIAKEAEFPLFDARYRYEHGSLLRQEMLVPVALWRGH
jgi:hypothetical protein